MSDNSLTPLSAATDRLAVADESYQGALRALQDLQCRAPMGGYDGDCRLPAGHQDDHAPQEEPGANAPDEYQQAYALYVAERERLVEAHEEWFALLQASEVTAEEFEAAKERNADALAQYKIAEATHAEAVLLLRRLQYEVPAPTASAEYREALEAVKLAERAAGDRHHEWTWATLELDARRCGHEAPGVWPCVARRGHEPATAHNHPTDTETLAKGPGISPDELEWLKRATGVDDEYLAKWPRVVWDEWARAMRTNGDEPCPSVPAWMRPLIPVWHWDFSLPQPCVAQLWPTEHDWFSEADRHSDFVIKLDAPSEGWYPSESAVREAWTLAARHALQPKLAMGVEPVAVPAFAAGYDAVDTGRYELEGVAGMVEAFYVDRTSGKDDIVAQLTRILGASPAPSIGPLQGEDVLAWEWIYG